MIHSATSRIAQPAGPILFPNGPEGPASAPKEASRGDRHPTPSAIPDAGPWGRLAQVPFFLEAPLHLLQRFPLPHPRTRWFVPANEAGPVLDRLSRAGLPHDILQVINQPANRAILGDHLVFLPPHNGLLRLASETRAAIAGILRQYPANAEITGPVVIPTGDVDRWFAGTSLRPELIALIKQMSYRRGEALVFSDLSVLMDHVRMEAEAWSLFSVICRTPAVLLRLELEAASDIDGIANYWSVGPDHRLRNLVPMLRVLASADGGERLDAAHLLPPLPRKLLNTYPDLSMMADGILPDCHWTSLNFFNPQAEPFLLDERLATTVVLERYDTVAPPYRLGDVLVFLDSQHGNAFHTCVYVADDVVFTKNGRNLLSPWVFQTLEHVRKTYLFENNGSILGYRAKDPAQR